MSGRKSNLQVYQCITNGSMTGTSTITSEVVNIVWFDTIGFQFNWMGTPTGTFAIQVSIDYQQDLK